MLLGFQPRYVFGIAAVDLIGKADYSGTEEVHGLRAGVFVAKSTSCG